MLITTYKEANQLQSSCISLPTLPYLNLHHTCSVANKVRARDMHLSCVARVCYPACAQQNRLQQCMCTQVFEVLHALNVQAHVCTFISV